MDLLSWILPLAPVAACSFLPVPCCRRWVACVCVGKRLLHFRQLAVLPVLRQRVEPLDALAQLAGQGAPIALPVSIPRHLALTLGRQSAKVAHGLRGQHFAPLNVVFNLSCFLSFMFS